MKGILPWLVGWACHAGTRDLCSALAALVSTKYFFLTVNSFNSFVPTDQQVGHGHAAALGRMSLSTYVSLVFNMLSWALN
jgi:hypothetical protein